MFNSRQLGTELLGALTARRVQDGFRLLDRVRQEFSSLDVSDPHTPALILCLALWTDVGYRSPTPVSKLIARFPVELSRRLPLQDYLRLAMAQGYAAMVGENLEEALSFLQFVLRAEREVGDSLLVSACHFWKGRCHRKRGEYDLAMNELLAARELVQDMMPRFAAVIEIQESWLAFQKGRMPDAQRMLDRAESQLCATDDLLSLGNIASARGRIARQAGRYSEALGYFDLAVKTYGRLDPNHRNLARALVNAAYVKRLIALQIRKRIDSRAARSGERPLAGRGKSAGSEHRRYVQLCREALDQLGRAGEVYRLNELHSGTGAVLVSTGYLHLDGGAPELAAQEARKAYELAHEKNDHILMARACMLQAAIENARVDERTGDEADIAVQASAARQYAEEAIRLAESTQNRLLTAEAYISMGITAGNDFFQEWDEAKAFADRASALLTPNDRDHAWEDLLALRARILRASGIDDTLRAWSDGIVGDKTFQQVSEEFAELVIPKVWIREGKKVSRVAERLSISPKKVRRILRRVGLLTRGEESS